MSQQRLPCPPLTSTRLLQARLPDHAGTPYLIKVQNAEEVPGILLGNLDSFFCGHTAVTCQAVTQKYLGISQLMELSLLGKKDAVLASSSARGSQGDSSTDTDTEHLRCRQAGPGAPAAGGHSHSNRHQQVTQMTRPALSHGRRKAALLCPGS